jgi:hypothetical protein
MSAHQFETHCRATNKLELNRLTDRPQVEIVPIERLLPLRHYENDV